jgi:hypothetical protein
VMHPYDQTLVQAELDYERRERDEERQFGDWCTKHGARSDSSCITCQYGWIAKTLGSKRLYYICDDNSGGCCMERAEFLSHPCGRCDCYRGFEI